MSIRKYQSVEDTEVVSPEDHKKIEAGLHSIGKTSAVDLTDEERRVALPSDE